MTAPFERKLILQFKFVNSKVNNVVLDFNFKDKIVFESYLAS